MNLPPRPSKGSPPRRAALHERSDSHTNERAPPTLRIIGDPQAQIHASSPFPTKPSHILSPKVYDGQGSTIGPSLGVSNGREPQIETKNDIEDQLNTVTPPQPRSGSLDTKDAFYTPMQGTIPEPDTNTSFPAMEEDIDNNDSRVSDDVVQLPSISPGLESSELYGTANPREAARQPASKDSDASLSSSNSTGTVIVKRTRDGRGRGSYSAFPNTARPGSSKSNLSLSTAPKPITRDMGGVDSPISPISPSSPVSPGYAMPQERRVSSVPMYANLHASSQNSVNLQYPVIRPPSASASWYVNFGNVTSLVGRHYLYCRGVLRSMKPILPPMIPIITLIPTGSSPCLGSVLGSISWSPTDLWAFQPHSSMTSQARAA